MTTAGYYTKVTIDGVDVSSYIMEYEADDTTALIDDPAQIVASQDLLAVSGVDLDPGSEVTIQRGTDASTLIYLFRGYIVSSTPKSSTIDIQCRNKLWLLRQRRVTKSFDRDVDTEAGVLSEIIKTLVTTYGGLYADGTSIQDSGSVTTLRKYICRNDVVFERVEKLVAALNWQLYYNPQDDKVYLEPLGYRTYNNTLTFDLSGASIVSSTLPILNRDFTSLFNRIVVNGAKQLDTRDESFTATAAQTEFTLEYTPLQTQVTINGGTPLIRGALDQTATIFQYTVDETFNRVTLASAMAGGETVRVVYSAMVPMPVVVVDPVSVEKYCPTNPYTSLKTPFEIVYTFNDIISVEDALLRANKLKTFHSEPTTTYEATVTQDLALFYPGYGVPIVDSINGFTGTLYVQKIKRHYPEPFDWIFLADDRIVGGLELDDLQTRVGLLEKESLRNTSVLLHLFSFDRQEAWERRYFKLFRITVEGTNLIWDHVTYGKWDTFKWATTSSIGGEVVQQIVPGQNTFKEFFYDTTFIDTANTTSTIDTTNKRVHS